LYFLGLPINKTGSPTLISVAFLISSLKARAWMVEVESSKVKVIRDSEVCLSITVAIKFILET
jgi:hypothetical protein